MKNRIAAMCVGVACLTSPGAALAQSCWVTATDAYLGSNTSGGAGYMGLKALVETYRTNRYAMSLLGNGIQNATVLFQVIFPGETSAWDLGTANSGPDGWVEFDLSKVYGKDSSGFYLKVTRNGAVTTRRLTQSQYIQVVASTVGTPTGCEGAVVPDQFGTMYFRHPNDISPILFSDLDDTLFNTTDPINVIHSMITAHYEPIDDYAVDATWEYRNAGGVYIGITAQFAEFRPITRSELLAWGFDEPYTEQEYYHADPGYNAHYMGRSLSYIANDDYPINGDPVDYQRDHCELKTEKFGQFIGTVFGGRTDLVLGIVGDSEHSDGCAACAFGIHWYALMEEGDRVSAEYPCPNGYTEILDGWQEALGEICGDAGLGCGF